MATISFFARGDSNTANNAALNAQNTNTTPTTEITFSSGASGNLLLEPNGGNTDPDTTVIVNGVEMSFTVKFFWNTAVHQQIEQREWSGLARRAYCGDHNSGRTEIVLFDQWHHRSHNGRLS